MTVLTSAQLALVRADIAADPILMAHPNTPDGCFAIADLYNQLAIPDYTVWRTDLHEHEITARPSAEGTSWSWTTYRNQDVREQNAWVRMFNTSLMVNMSLPNVRQGISDIFSGAGAAAAQRAHILSAGKRRATRIEALLAVGPGTLALPATMGYEGAVTYQEIQAARE